MNIARDEVSHYLVALRLHFGIEMALDGIVVFNFFFEEVNLGFMVLLSFFELTDVIYELLFAIFVDEVLPKSESIIFYRLIYTSN